MLSSPHSRVLPLTDQTGVGNQQDSFWNILLLVLSLLMIPVGSVNPKISLNPKSGFKNLGVPKPSLKGKILLLQGREVLRQVSGAGESQDVEN